VDINLRINDVGFIIGEGLDIKKLTSARCERAGLLARLTMRAPRGQTVYWAKNCEISCFGGKFTLWANLDARSADMMVGTSAYLYFKNRILEKVAFQVLENETIAVRATEEFERLCQGALGPPTSHSPTQWLYNSRVVACNLYYTRTRALFEWMTRQYLEGHPG